MVTKTFKSCNMGGHTFNNCSKIKKENIQPTLNKFLQPLVMGLGITYSDVLPLGSVFKKDYSGDIDMLIDGQTIATHFGIEKDLDTIIPQKIYDVLKETYPYLETNYTSGLKVCNIKYPIVGEKNQFVQIDLMTAFGKEGLRLGDFIYYSPGSCSNYSGAHRTSMLYTILRIVNIKPISHFENGKVKEFEKMSLLPVGLVKQRKSVEGSHGAIKTPKTLKKYTELITKDPYEIVKYILGEQGEISDVDSFESILNYLERGKNPDLTGKIKDIYQDWVKCFGRTLTIPNEIKKYLY
jgi:hypothetical protein